MGQLKSIDLEKLGLLPCGTGHTVDGVSQVIDARDCCLFSQSKPSHVTLKIDRLRET